MNKHLKVLSLLALLSISSLSLAYTWGFTNITDKILVIEMKITSAFDKFFNIVGPGQKVSFSWEGIATRRSACIASIGIGEYDEQKVKNFPGTNSPKLPKESGKNTLDSKKITSAVDARGEWFNSLDNISKNTDPLLFVLDNDPNNKFNPVAAKLMTGTSIQQAMTSLNINIPNELKAGIALEYIPSGSPLHAFLKLRSIICQSRDFFIVDNAGRLALVTKK